ncbi:putative RNA-dependent RNA polymerase [Freshwater macrophyte associated picorna-like virus 13]|nr:putative RNA-dependent RNA polymerase [Freshwater macrophyte associated picorna-like virus 13]
MNKDYKIKTGGIIKSTIGGATTNHSNNKKRNTCASKRAANQSNKKITQIRNKKRDDKVHYINGFSDIREPSPRLVHEMHSFEKRHNRNLSFYEFSDMFEALEMEPHGLDTSVEEPLASTSKTLLSVDSYKEFMEYAKDLSDNFPVCADMLSVLEDVFVTAFIITQTNDVSVMLASAFMFLKKRMNKDLLPTIYDYIASSGNKTMTPQSEGPTTRKFYKAGCDSWKTYMALPIFKHFGILSSIMISFGLFPEQKFDVHGFEVLSLKALSKQMDSFDLMDCVFSTFTFFLECGYQLYHGTLIPFLTINPDSINSLEENILHLRTHSTMVLLGTYESKSGRTLAYYQDLLMNTYKQLKQLHDAFAHDRSNREAVSRKIDFIVKLIIDFDNQMTLSGMRTAPYSINIYGKSSKGKSSVVMLLSAYILKVNGFPCADKNFCTIQPDDAYFSTFKADTQCVLLDDLANTVTDKTKVNPAERIIQIKNNISYFAPKADLLEKGRIQVKPKVLAVTTNVKDISARDWSQEPVSVMRRFDVIITVEVRDEFQVDKRLSSQRIKEWRDKNPVDLIYNTHTDVPDFWLLKVEKVVIKDSLVHGGPEVFEYETCMFDGKPLVDASIYTVMDFLQSDSSKHFANQKILVESNTQIGDKLKVCDCCKRLSQKCTCPPPPPEKPLEPQGLITMVGVATQALGWTATTTMLSGKVNSAIFSLFDHYKQQLTMDWFDRRTLGLVSDKFLYDVKRRWYIPHTAIWDYAPQWLRSYRPFRVWYYYSTTRRSLATTRWYAKWSFVIDIVLTIVFVLCKQKSLAIVLNVFFIPFWICFLSIILTVNTVRATMEMSRRPIKTLFDVSRYQFETRTTVLGIMSVLTASILLKTVRKMYTTYAQHCVAQGNLIPCAKNIEERNSEVNVWRHTPMAPPCNPNTADYTYDQVANTVQKNCVNVTIKHNNRLGITSGIFIKSNILMVPYHMVCYEKKISLGVIEDCEITITRANIEMGGSKWSENITKFSIQRVSEEDDLCLIQVHAGGVFRDITKFYAELTRDTHTHVVYRDKFGQINEIMAHVTKAPVSHGSDHDQVLINGGIAMYNQPTFLGMCMAVHISKTKQPSIVGHHIAGFTGETKGAMITVSREKIDAAVKLMTTRTHTFVPHSEGTFPMERLGKDLGYNPEVSTKAPISFIENYNLGLFGSIGCQTSYKSDVRISDMAVAAEKHLGIPNKWGKPRFNPQWRPWYRTMEYMVSPKSGIDAQLLSTAFDDYITPLKAWIKEYVEYSPSLRPLSDFEVINGISGCKFIDHMNFQSGIGFPLGGKKTKYLEGPPGEKRWKDPEMIHLEFERMKACYLKGERYYSIFKACLKDEVTPLDKDKVRVFMACDLMMQYAWRMYTLPLLRALSMNPLESEIAVGLNSGGNEWEQLERYVTFDGEADTTILACDYSKWDLQLPAQLVNVALQVIMDLAEASGTYSEEDLCMIRGLSTDTLYFMCHYNGSLIEAHGGMASGHNLTAHLNSICNALLVRTGFYSLYPKTVPFRSAVHATFYGDDCKAGVKPGFHNFNHHSYRDYLWKNLGMKITGCRKDEVDPKKFEHINTTDFLKRTSVYIPEIGCRVGAIDLDSIWRPFYCHGKLGCSKEDHYSAALRGAKNELFFHGRGIFDKYTPVLRDIALEMQIIDPFLHRSFDDHVSEWVNKYDPSLPDNVVGEPSPDFSTQVASWLMAFGAESNVEEIDFVPAEESDYSESTVLTSQQSSDGSQLIVRFTGPDNECMSELT